MALFIIPEVLRIKLSSFSAYDTRPLPSNLAIQAHAAKGNYLIIGDSKVVRRFNIDDLSMNVSLPTFDPNMIRFLRVDPFDSNVLYIDHQFPGTEISIAEYPYQAQRASVDPFQLIDISPFNISNTQINQNTFIDAYNGSEYFQFIGDSNPFPQSLPIVVKVSLQDQIELITVQRQGTEFTTRVDFINGSLILASSASIIRKSVIDTNYDYVSLNETTFPSNFQQEALFDEEYGYYVSTDGVVKIRLSDLSMQEKKVVNIGTWIDASLKLGDSLYFYYITFAFQEKDRQVMRYEYNSGVSTPLGSFIYNGITYSGIYSAVSDRTGSFLYCGAQLDSHNQSFVVRYNFESNSLDLITQLPKARQISYMVIDNTGDYMVVTTNADSYKIKIPDLSIVATLPQQNFDRISTCVFDSANNLYMSSSGRRYTLYAYKMNFTSFTMVDSYTINRAQGGSGTYDACTDTVYLVGSDYFQRGNGNQPSNIAAIGTGGKCDLSAHTTSAPTSSQAPQTPQAPTTNAPSITEPTRSVSSASPVLAATSLLMFLFVFVN
jgi:hypothetical protein